MLKTEVLAEFDGGWRIVCFYYKYDLCPPRSSTIISSTRLLCSHDCYFNVAYADHKKVCNCEPPDHILTIFKLAYG